MAEACYVPRYLQASFKGVAFEATEAVSEHGRRGAEGEFPFGEQTAYADLGRKIRVYKIKARFPRNSHIGDAGRLIAACESPGPGVLMHPTRGAVRVACRQIEVRDEIFDSAGITTADIDFVEANLWTAGILGSALGGLAIGPITAALGSVFQTAWAGVQIAAFFDRPFATAAMSSALGQIRSQTLSVSAFGGNREMWRVAGELQSIAASPQALVDPKRAWTALSGGYQGIDVFANGRSERWQAHRALANWSGRLAPARGAARAPVDAMVATMRALSAVHLTRLALEDAGSTLAAALAQHDTVMALLDGELSIARAACNDKLWLALTEFKTDAQKALLARAYELPPLIRCNIGRPVSALVAAHEIYGDARKFGVIEQYNSSGLPFALGPVITAPRV